MTIRYNTDCASTVLAALVLEECKDPEVAVRLWAIATVISVGARSFEDRPLFNLAERLSDFVLFGAIRAVDAGEDTAGEDDSHDD